MWRYWLDLMGSQQGLIKHTITNLWIPQNRRNFLTTKESISFQRTPFHAVSTLTCSLVLHALSGQAPCCPQGKYLQPSVTWTVSLIWFNKHNRCTEHMVNLLAGKCLATLTHHSEDSTQSSNHYPCFTKFSMYYHHVIQLYIQSNLLFVNIGLLVNSAPLPHPFSMYVYTHTWLLRESITNYVAFLWVEVGQLCLIFLSSASTKHILI